MTTLALIADLHGNLAALDATLAAIRAAGIDQIICLGDVAATGPQPQEVLARLRAVGCPVVMGNADWELLAAGGLPAPGSDAARWAEMSAWATAQLDATDRAQIAGWPATLTVPLGDGSALLAMHGSPRSFNDTLRGGTPDDDILATLGELDPTITVLAGGHTHVPLLRQIGHRTLINPGSVGLPYRFYPDASVTVPSYAAYAVIAMTATGPDIAFHRAVYDSAVTVAAMIANDMPHAEWWRTGWELAGTGPTADARRSPVA